MVAHHCCQRKRNVYPHVLQPETRRFQAKTRDKPRRGTNYHVEPAPVHPRAFFHCLDCVCACASFLLIGQPAIDPPKTHLAIHPLHQLPLVLHRLPAQARLLHDAQHQAHPDHLDPLLGVPLATAQQGGLRLPRADTAAELREEEAQAAVPLVQLPHREEAVGEARLDLLLLGERDGGGEGLAPLFQVPLLGLCR